MTASDVDDRVGRDDDDPGEWWRGGVGGHHRLVADAADPADADTAATMKPMVAISLRLFPSPPSPLSLDLMKTLYNDTCTAADDVDQAMARCLYPRGSAAKVARSILIDCARVCHASPPDRISFFSFSCFFFTLSFLSFPLSGRS